MPHRLGPKLILSLTVLIVVITRSLVLVGLPSEWHSVLLGLVIVVSTAATARGARVRAVGAAR